MASPSRSIAFDILRKVDRGGYASDLLAAATQPLEERDAGLASAIVFGVLRFQAQLDCLIAHYSGRAAAGLDAEVRLALRMGIYQLRYLERVPPHAAVAESVELVKRARKRSAAGFVNAVLRKVDRARVDWPDRATELSHPEWMLARWERQYGAEAMRSIARANLQPATTHVRETAAATPLRFRTQDIGAQSIVPLLRLEGGQSFLDVCAAPGNKTAQALEYGVRAVACDIHLHRLAPLRELGIPLVVADGTRPLPFAQRFDRTLVDAPCTGTGTLARNPEIKWRLRPEDVSDLQSRQRALLRNAVAALAPQGLLVYSTCSLEREENEEIVAGYGAIETMHRIPGRDAGDGFFAAVIKSDKPAND